MGWHCRLLLNQFPEYIAVVKDIENIEMVDIFEDSIVVGDVEIENDVETVDTDIHISEV